MTEKQHRSGGIVHRLGQYPHPSHVLAHVSDPHLLGGGRQLFDTVDVGRTLVRALTQLERAGQRPGAIVVTGDLADLGEPDAYRQLKAVMEPAAERMGARIVWVMGNHDKRSAFASVLLSAGPSTEPQDQVYDVDGLRIVALDTSVPGYDHGELTDGQLAWLGEVLATPAPAGTILAMHHPPIPSAVEIMALTELQEQHRLADVIRGTDVRGILAGHFHCSIHSTFAGVPVSVAAATCYTIDASTPEGMLAGIDAGQSFNLVHVFDDAIVHTTIPVHDAPVVTSFPGFELERLRSMSPEQLMQAFSRKRA
jgi:3',5'-cyclic-AMP phosphodiesterase